MLRIEGPATATTLAQRLGLNTGATSYHLRQLAQHGFITDDAERGNGRDRWWRAAHASTRTDWEEDPDPRTARRPSTPTCSRSSWSTPRCSSRSVEERSTLSQEWRNASTCSDWRCRLTPEQAERLIDVLDETDRGVRGRPRSDRGRRPERPSSSCSSAFPRPGTAWWRRHVVRRPLYGWLGAEAVSLAGTRVSMIALPFFVLTTTGSPEKTGLVALAEMLPLVVLKVLGGPIIDRVGARRVAITCDWASVVVVGAIPFLYDAGLCRSRRSSRWSPWPARCADRATRPRAAMTPTLAAIAGCRWSGSPA